MPDIRADSLGTQRRFEGRAGHHCPPRRVPGSSTAPRIVRNGRGGARDRWADPLVGGPTLTSVRPPTARGPLSSMTWSPPQPSDGRAASVTTVRIDRSGRRTSWTKDHRRTSRSCSMVCRHTRNPTERATSPRSPHAERTIASRRAQPAGRRRGSSSNSPEVVSRSAARRMSHAERFRSLKRFRVQGRRAPPVPGSTAFAIPVRRTAPDGPVRVCAGERGVLLGCSWHGVRRPGQRSSAGEQIATSATAAPSTSMVPAWSIPLPARTVFAAMMAPTSHRGVRTGYAQAGGSVLSVARSACLAASPSMRAVWRAIGVHPSAKGGVLSGSGEHALRSVALSRSRSRVGRHCAHGYGAQALSRSGQAAPVGSSWSSGVVSSGSLCWSVRVGERSRSLGPRV